MDTLGYHGKSTAHSVRSFLDLLGPRYWWSTQ